MNRILVLMLALALAVFFAACGAKDAVQEAVRGAVSGGESVASSNQDDSKEATPPEKQGDSGDADLTTVEGFLTAFGLTQEDVRCANFNRLDITSNSLETGEIYEVGAYISEKLTDEQAKAWLDQILAKLESLSESGKIKNILEDADLTTDYIMSQSMYVGSGTYMYDGKKVVVLLSVIPGYLDSEDPDDAMAACTLGLEWAN
jgi:hypothetical protein